MKISKHTITIISIVVIVIMGFMFAQIYMTESFRFKELLLFFIFLISFIFGYLLMDVLFFSGDNDENKM